MTGLIMPDASKLLETISHAELLCTYTWLGPAVCQVNLIGIAGICCTAQRTPGGDCSASWRDWGQQCVMCKIFDAPAVYLGVLVGVTAQRC